MSEDDIVEAIKNIIADQRTKDPVAISALHLAAARFYEIGNNRDTAKFHYEQCLTNIENKSILINVKEDIKKHIREHFK